MQAAGFRSEGMHGDLDQHSRMAMLTDFKAGKLHVLVATDVAARGLDIRTIRTVINYDAAKSIDTHVHRIGRTGRAGDKDGVAVTLLMPAETRMAAALVENIRSAGQDVPQCAPSLARRPLQRVCTSHAFLVLGMQGRRSSRMGSQFSWCSRVQALANLRVPAGQS